MFKDSFQKSVLCALIAVFSFFPYGQYLFDGVSLGLIDTPMAEAAGDGSVGAPFTDLFSVYRASQQAGFATGTYSFNIDGNAFSSYVDTDGYVAVASADNGETNDATGYTEVTAMTLNSDDILSRTILAAVNPDELRITSTGVTTADRISTDPLYIARLNSFQTLSAVNGATWAGSGGVLADGAGADRDLNEVIWHSSGSGGSLHWFPDGNTDGSQHDGFGSTLNTSEPTLWMRDTSPNVTPGGVADDLVLWVKADEGGTAWTDESGSITTVTPAGTPTLNANSLNFNDQVSFNGSSWYNLTNAGFANGTGDKAIYVVGSRNTNAGATYAVTVGSGSSNRFASFGHWTNFPNDPFISTSGSEVTSNDASWPINTSAIVGYALDGGSDQLYTNGASLGIAQDDVSLNVTNGNLGWIGAFNNGGAQWNGDIAEVIVYNQSTNSNTDRQQIESYLAVKYGMTLDQTTPTDYVGSDGSVFWDSSADTNYNQDIVGLARDDASGLDQRISKSVNAGTILTIANDDNTTDFTSPNSSASRSQLNDLQSIAVASNGAATTTQTTELNVLGASNNQNLRTAREWQIHNPNDLDVSLKFEGFGGYDVIGDSDGDFSAGAFVAGTLDVNGEADGVYFEDGEYFTLATTTAAPGGVTSDLALWLRADAGLTANGSNEVTDWNEQSNTRTETINGTPTLIANGLNFNPWVEFDPGTGVGASTASTDWIDWPNFTSAYTEGQAYIVMEHNDDPAVSQFQGAFWGLGEETILWNDGRIFEAFGYNVSGTDRSIFNPTKPFDEPLVYSAAIDDSANSARTIRIDGLQVNSKNNTDVNFGTQPISLGRTNLNSLISSNRGFGGRIAEFIVFSSDQDSPNEEQVESYLALKYGITLDTSIESYKNSDGADVYDLAPEQTFNFAFAATNNGGGSAPSGRGGAANTFTLTAPATVNITHTGVSVAGNAGIGISTTVLPDDANPVAASDSYTTTGDRIDATTSSKSYSTSLSAGTYYVGVFSGGGSSAASHNVTITVDNIASYEENIVGIARDDASGLDQQISKSVNDDAILTLSTDTNFTDANGTHTSLDDGQFVVVGSNGLANTAQQTELPAGTTDGLSREWRLENTGSVASVNMKFDGFDDSWMLYADSNADFGADARQIGTLNADGEITVTLGTNGTTEIDDGEFFTLAQTAAAVDIAGVSGGLTLWLDADDASTVFQNRACTGLSVAGETAATTGDVGCWLDKSGQNNHVSVLTDEVREPLYIDSALNGKNVLDFQGDSLVTPDGDQITSNTSYTKFAVFRYDTRTPYNNIISSASNAGGGHAFFGGVGRSNLALFHGGTFNEVVGQPGVGKYTVGTGRYGAPDSLTNVTNVNGIESAVSTNVRNFNGTHRTEIGSVFGGGFGLDGHLAEAIIFDRALTDAEIDEVECYLSTKWDIAISNDSPNCVPTLATVEFSASAGASTDETTNDNFIELLVSGTTTAPATVDVVIIGGTASFGSDYTFANPTTVTIPVGVYDGTTATAISVPLPTLPDDAVAEGNETLVLSLTNPTGEAVLGDANVDATEAHSFSYTITDDDSAAISLSVQNNLMVEGGLAAAVVEVRLNSRPTADVTVTLNIFGDDQTEGAFNVARTAFTTDVTITPATWDTPALVLVFGVDDIIDDGNQNVNIISTGATSADPNYNLGGSAIADVVVINQDNDISDIVVTSADNETSEDGDTAIVTLTPSSAPTEEVLVPLTITDLTEGSVVESSVVLASGTVASVDVTVTGVDDTDLDPDVIYQIILGDPISVDANYDALTAADVANQNLINFDNDDTDNDGNADSIEDAGNNGGDGNGDGTPDSQQSDVSGTPNPLTGDYTTIQAAGGCTFITENAAVAEGSLAAQDPSFEYPVGLVDFQVQCATPGDSSTVTIYYGQEYDTTNWTWRKFNDVGDVYSDISSLVTYGTSTLGTDIVTTATFTVTDGDPTTDEDGIANGLINDPSGPATPVIVASSGGSNSSGTRRICDDPQATNYDSSVSGRHVQSLCEYEDEAEIEEVITQNTSLSCPYFTQYMRVGSTGDQVTAVQAFMQTKGYYTGSLNGLFDTALDQSVRDFQNDNWATILQPWGIAQGGGTGYLYQSTRAHMNILAGCDVCVTLDNGQTVGCDDPAPLLQTIAPTTTTIPATCTFTPAKPGDDNDNVANIQTFLNQQGFMNFPATGYYGQITRDAVKRFQSAYPEIYQNAGLSEPTNWFYTGSVQKAGELCAET